MARSGEPDRAQPILPTIPFESCPIRASLGVLGRKWALLVLRDISFFPAMTFTGILRNNPGLTPRVLSMRLRELRDEGIVERIPSQDDPGARRYRLTEKGRDIVPILTAFIQFGIRHHAARVFEDGRPRRLEQVFPERQDVLLGSLRAYAGAARANP